MPDRRRLALALLMLAVPAAAVETADRPVAVSPGDASRLVRVADRCPTFSWGQLAGAEAYDLVVWALGRDEEEAPAALRVTIDGRAGSWTPTLGRCLERGGRYAWSLRARRGGSTSRWSAPALFEVAPGPSAGELERALAVVRDWAAGAQSPTPMKTANPALARGGSLPGVPGAGPHRPGRDPENPIAGRTAAGSADAPGDGPSAGVAASAAMSVDGPIEAVSFRGDGSELAGVQATGLSCAGCVTGVEIGDGAVTAAKIGEACAPGQVLQRGGAGWQCATLTAPACTPGDQVGCYTGPAGTPGVGECRGGTRVCAADSTYGPCAGEVVPAAAEACDGLDNTCDGSIDEGDPAVLCPPTAHVATTLCDAAGCLIETCDALWADSDGDYANGCEAPAPGACLEGGVPRPVAGPGEGELVIQEILADPAAPLTDAAAEWFEVAATAAVDLNGVGIGTAFGTVIDEIEAAECLSVQGGDLLIFARSADPAANGGLAADHTFGFSLVNGGGELHLAYGGNLVDAISWSAGDVEPGRARNLPPGLADATSNDDPSNWCLVPADPGLAYTDGNHGTPGLANEDCP